MFVVTREHYHTEMATAVFNHLRDFLLTKERNHCQRVEYLPIEVMRTICRKLNEDIELQSKGVEAYVLAEKTQEEHEIESGALIEKRNRESFGVLVAFIPQGLRLPAEDSYDIQTFKTYDLTGILRNHITSMIESLPQENQADVRRILDQTAIRRLPVDCHIKYLIALKNDAAGWEESGAYLFHLNLVPDLYLTEKGLDIRIDRNYHCVLELANPERSVFLGVENLVNDYGLDPDANKLRENLISFLRNQDVSEKESWLPEILYNDQWQTNLTFDKWKFRDVISPGEIEVHLDPLKNPKTGVIASGLKEDEAGNLIATSDARSPIALKWTTYPRRPENLAHYLILVVRDTDDEAGGEELVRRTVKGGRQTLKLSLKDIELDEGETCAAKILIHAKDHAGLILATDESEPFWIEGGIEITETVKKVTRIRNRAEAIFLAALKHRKSPEVDSEGWEEGRPNNFYRIKLKNREIYRIVLSSLLHEIELKNIADPLTCGAWTADTRNRAVLGTEQLQPVIVAASGLQSFGVFCEARRELFNRFQEKDPRGVIEVFDLREFKEEILTYVATYRDMLDELKANIESAKTDGQVNNVLNEGYQLSRIDTIYLKVGTPDDEGEVVLLMPTHPLRVLWVLQFQQLLFHWADELGGPLGNESVEISDPESIEKITSLNIPSTLAFAQGEIYVNSDNIDLYWSILPKGTTSDIRKVVALVCRVLGLRTLGNITSVTSAQVADKIWRYLKHHPYVSTIRINVINPGDGLLVLDAIREIQKTGDFDDLNYDVAFYGDLRYEVMGSVFDDLTQEIVLTEGSRPDVDEALLAPNRNPLFPKMMFSKQRVLEQNWKDTQLREAHIAILIDRFSTKVLTRPIGSGPGSFCLHNLLAEYQADFDIKGDTATWSRKVVPNRNEELAGDDHCAEAIHGITDTLLRIEASVYDWGNSIDKAPAIQLELSDIDKHIISKIHESSDWVVTIDRNFGIEYFDNPRSAPGVNVRSYLIDYTPEFMEGIGHRLIVSTFWLSEIEGLIQDGLRKMGIPGTGFHAVQILDVLRSISGKLALKLINNPNDAREIIGLALTRLYLEKQGSLQDSILIPVDSHIDLFVQHKRQLSDADIRIHRNDLILARAQNNILNLMLIEVKFRTGLGGVAEEYSLKEAIVQKNDDTQIVLETRFLPNPEHDRLDHEIQSKQFASLLHFYFERCKRHGMVDPLSENALALKSVIQQIGQGHLNLTFEKSGYIFNLHGPSKPPEEFMGNTVFVVGDEKIRELLEIAEDVEVPAEFPPQPVESSPTHEEAVKLDDDSLVQDKVEETEIVSEEQPVQLEAVGEVTELSGSDNIQPSTEFQEKAEEVPKDIDIGICLYLGKDNDTQRDVYWDPLTKQPKKLTNQHLLIVGKSGAGKTQTAAAFVWELSKAGIPSIIFDFQGEYMSKGLMNGNGQTFLECTSGHVLDAADGINVNPLDVPLDPLTGNSSNYMKAVYQVATSLAKIFGLGDIQAAILRDAIGQAFSIKGFIPGNKSTWNGAAPALADVWGILKHMEATQGGNVRNLNMRVQPLFETGVFLDSGDSQSFDEILKETSIIRLSNLATPELMVAVSRFVLQKIYANMLAQGPSDKLRVFAVVDEAHKLSYDETLTELIREARKYGVGILLASQSVKDFDRVVFDMVGTKIALQLEGEDAKIMSDNLGVTAKHERDTVRQIMLHQPPFRSLIRSNHFEPYIQVDITPFWQKGD